MNILLHTSDPTSISAAGLLQPKRDVGTSESAATALKERLVNRLTRFGAGESCTIPIVKRLWRLEVRGLTEPFVEL